jgi:hypothetical protein
METQKADPKGYGFGEAFVGDAKAQLGKLFGKAYEEAKRAGDAWTYGHPEYARLRSEVSNIYRKLGELPEAWWEDQKIESVLKDAIDHITNCNPVLNAEQLKWYADRLPGKT